MNNPITKRILIVDDEPNVAATLSESLQALGDKYQVDVANNGITALDLAKKTTYDIILTDYKMPGMSGIELAVAVNKLTPATQIILMTAYGSESLRNSAQSAPLNAFINKPFSIKQIREVIVNALEKTSSSTSDPFRTGEKLAPQGMRQELDRLQANTGARLVVLISSSGYPVETSGQTSGLDLSGVGALVAANFVAATELARILGNDTVFKTSYHESGDHNIYAYALDRDFILTVVFGNEIKPGAVWFYTKQSATTLNALLVSMSLQGVMPDVGMDTLDAALDDMFGTDTDARASIMSYEDAVQRKVLPSLLPKK